MCKLVPVLRVIGFVFLVIAIVACVVGFVAPFWIHLPLDHDGGDRDAETTITTTLAAHHAALQPTRPTTDMSGALATSTSSSVLGMGESFISGLLQNGSYHGLWAKCFHNFSCSCFWQNDFAMEKEFPGITYTALPYL